MGSQIVVVVVVDNKRQLIRAVHVVVIFVFRFSFLIRFIFGSLMCLCLEGRKLGGGERK